MKKNDYRESLIWWDGKQKKISEFIKELFDDDVELDPDDEDNSWRKCYDNNRVD